MPTFDEIIAREKRLLSSLTKFALTEKDPLGDGDQTPFPRGLSLQVETFLSAWAAGDSVNMVLSLPDDAPLHLLIPDPAQLAFVRACSSGRAAEVRALLGAASPAHALALMETHHTPLCLNALLYTVAGARLSAVAALPGSLPDSDHAAVAGALLEAGARVGSRDVRGYTPLHHATSSTWSRASLAVAQVLIRRGADVNARCRGGGNPLLESSQSAALAGDDKWAPPVRLLLEAGCDPAMKDDSGCSSIGIVSPMLVMRGKGPTTFMALVSEASRRGRAGAGATLEGTRVTLAGLQAAPELNGVTALAGEYDPHTGRYRVAVEGRGALMIKSENLRALGAPAPIAACATCGKAPPAVQLALCARCNDASYCSLACQKRDWREGGHKERCKAAAPGEGGAATVLLPRPAGGGEVFVSSAYGGAAAEYKAWDLGALQRGKTTVLKLQQPTNAHTPEQRVLRLYDETRRFSCNVGHTEQPAYDALLGLMGEALKVFVMVAPEGKGIRITLQKLRPLGW